MGFVLVTQPAKEPVTIEEAKRHLRIDTTDSDEEIKALITTARRYVERDTRRSLITQTWRSEYWNFPRRGRAYVQLAHGPISAITGVTYIDTASVVQTLDPSLYVADLAREIPRVYSAPHACWPCCLDQPGSVKVTYTTGYGPAADDVPRELRYAILFLMAHWFANREAVVIENVTPAEVPMAAQAILDIYRIPHLS